MLRLAAATALSALAAACAAPGPATVSGECRLLRPAPYAIQADTRVGQRWIDTTIEAGVAGCDHPRPPRRLD